MTEAPAPRATAVSSGRPLTPRARAAAARAGGAGTSPEVRVKASPLARKIAASRGVRLDSVKGTSACIRHTCLLATEMARLMGPVDEEAYYVAIEFTVESLLKEIVAMVERYSAAGV